MDVKAHLDKLNYAHKIKIRCWFNRSKKSLYLDYYDNGIRKTFYPDLALSGDDSLDRKTINVIKAIRDKKEHDITYQNAGIDIFDNNKDTTLLSDFAHALFVGRRVHVREFYMSPVNSLIKYASDMSLSRYNHQTIESWLSTLTVSEMTKYNYLRGLKFIFSNAVKKNKIRSNPCADFKCKMPESKREFLTIEEVNRLAAVDFDIPVIKDAFIFSCFTGLRLGDIRNLKWANIVNGYLEYTQLKTGNVERMKLHNEALLIVKRQPRFSDYVFTLHAQKRFYIHFKRMMKLVDIPKTITFHCARHTFATLLLTYGEGIYTVKNLLGHRDIRATEIYAKLIDKKKDEAIDKLPTLKQSKT